MIISFYLIFAFQFSNLYRCSHLRGLDPALTAFYSRDKGKFRCLDDSSVIPFDRVNDDYCDCSDGSDEPGSSACPNSRFFCANIQHLSKTISSSKVDDWSCDCCDGSDEREGICKNTCRETHEKLSREVEKRKISLLAGVKIAEEFVSKSVKDIVENAQRAIEENIIKIDDLQSKIENISGHVSQAKQEMDSFKASISKSEESKAAADGSDDLRSDGVDESEIISSFDLFDKNKDGSIEKIELWDSKAISSPYIDDVKDWVKDNPVDRKRFIELWKERILNKKVTVDSSDASGVRNEENDVHSMSQRHVVQNPISDNHIKHDEEKEKKDSTLEASAYELADSMDSGKNRTHISTQDELEKLNFLERKYEKLKSMEEKYQSELQSIQNLRREEEKIIQDDFGPSKVYLMIHQKCFEFPSSEFIYIFCGFKDIRQRMRSESHSSYGILLGSFKNWENSKTMYYGDGQSCWNGPSRSVKVKLECAETNELVEVKEPTKCHYEMVFRTPATCYQIDNAELEHLVTYVRHIHPEL